jgi:hypothetical protein
MAFESMLVRAASVISLQAFWQTAVYPEGAATGACNARRHVVRMIRLAEAKSGSACRSWTQR